jgi:hypothetical protein
MWDENDRYNEVKLSLVGEIECRDCHLTAVCKVPAKLDSRDTVIARTQDVELPDGWSKPNNDGRHYYEFEHGYLCPDCILLRAAKKEAAEKADAEKKALREAKKAAKAAQKAEAAKSE